MNRVHSSLLHIFIFIYIYTTSSWWLNRTNPFEKHARQNLNFPPNFGVKIPKKYLKFRHRVPGTQMGPPVLIGASGLAAKDGDSDAFVCGGSIKK